MNKIPQDMRFRQSLLKKLQTKAMKNQNWVKKCVSWIKDFLRDLKAAYANINPDSPEGELVINDKAFLEGLIERFDRAFSNNSSEILSNLQESEIIRKQERTYDYWLDKIDTISDEQAKFENSNNTFLQVLEHTPKILQECGARDFPIKMRFDAMYLAQRKDGVFNGHYHNFGKSIMSNLGKYLAEPDAILQTVSEKGKTRLQVLKGVPTERGQALASVELDAKHDIGRGDEDDNFVVTFFDMEKRYFKKLFSKYSAVIKYKKESLPFDNPKLHEWFGTINESDPSSDSLTQKGTTVNNNYMTEKSNNDAEIHFQSRDYGTIGDVDVSAELAKDNAKLKKDNEYLRKLVGLTGGQYYTKTSLGVATSDVMKEAGVSRGKERVQGMLQELYRYIAKGEEVTWDEIMRRSRNIAIQMQDMKPKKETVDPYLEEIRKAIQSRRISLTYTQWQEAEHLYGSVQNFRRQNMGRFTVANDGVPLDVAWAELSHLYPGTFDPDINEGDMVSQLVEIYESTKSTIPEYFDVEEEIRSLSCGV